MLCMFFMYYQFLSRFLLTYLQKLRHFMHNNGSFWKMIVNNRKSNADTIINNKGDFCNLHEASGKGNIHFNYNLCIWKTKKCNLPQEITFLFIDETITYFKILICQNQSTANMVKEKQSLDDFAVSFGKGEKTIQCNICEKTFSSENSVKRHIGPFIMQPLF